MNVISRWPGSVHDATIFNSSNVRAEFDGGRYGNAILLGIYLYLLLFNKFSNMEL